MFVKIEFDTAKRDRVLAERGLDLADATLLFGGFHLTRRDDVHSGAEERFVSIGNVGGTVVIVIWTERLDVRRIITMWKANAKERTAYREYVRRLG